MATSLDETTPPGRPVPEPLAPERFWNLPNTITLLRTGAIPVLLLLPALNASRGVSLLAAWIFILAAVTDIVDGWLARRGAQVTRIGKLLDPLVDKLLVATALIVLLAVDRIPTWGVLFVVVIVGRELAVTGLRGLASAGGHVMAASGWGKLKTVFQNIAIAALLFPDPTLGLPAHGIGMGFLVLAAGLTAWSGYGYFADYFGGSMHGPGDSGGGDA